MPKKNLKLKKTVVKSPVVEKPAVTATPVPVVSQPMIDKLVFVLPFGVGIEYRWEADGKELLEMLKTNIDDLKGKGACVMWRSDNRHYHIQTKFELPGGSTAFVEFGARRPHIQKGGVRVELNPSKIDRDDVKALRRFIRKATGLGKDEMDTLLINAVVNRIDVAIEVSPMTIEDLLIDYRQAQEVTMFAKRMKKGKIETINFGSVTSDYCYAVYGKREEEIHRAIEEVAKRGTGVTSALKDALVRRVKQKADAPPTMRVEVRGKRMGAAVSELASRGENRLERFHFTSVQALGELTPLMQLCFLSRARDVGLRAALKDFESTKLHAKIKKAVEQKVGWWDPKGAWAGALQSLRATRLFPAEAFETNKAKKPKSK